MLPFTRVCKLLIHAVPDSIHGHVLNLARARRRLGHYAAKLHQEFGMVCKTGQRGDMRHWPGQRVCVCVCVCVFANMQSERRRKCGI